MGGVELFHKMFDPLPDGTAKPVRWRVRPPAFINLAALPAMCEGHLLSDMIAINASIDIVMGEVDR